MIVIFLYFWITLGVSAAIHTQLKNNDLSRAVFKHMTIDDKIDMLGVCVLTLGFALIGPIAWIIIIASCYDTFLYNKLPINKDTY